MQWIEGRYDSPLAQDILSPHERDSRPRMLVLLGR